MRGGCIIYSDENDYVGGSTIILPRSSLARSIPYPSIPLSLYIPPPSTLTYHLSILCPPPPVGGTRICLVLGSAKASLPSCLCSLCVVWYGIVKVFSQVSGIMLNQNAMLLACVIVQSVWYVCFAPEALAPKAVCVVCVLLYLY